MAEHDPAEVVGDHLSLILRWWAVIVVVVSLGYAGIRKGIVAPRDELRSLQDAVDDLRADFMEVAGRHEGRIDEVMRRLEHMQDTILQLHSGKD